MSLIGSLLAFVIIPLKVKPLQERPPKPDRSAEVEAMTFALDHWRNAYAHLWRENERLKAECERLRDAAERQNSNQLASAQDCQRLGLVAHEVVHNLSYWNCVPSRSEVIGSIVRGSENDLRS